MLVGLGRPVEDSRVLCCSAVHLVVGLGRGSDPVGGRRGGRVVEESESDRGLATCQYWWHEIEAPSEKNRFVVYCCAGRHAVFYLHDDPCCEEW